MSSEGEVAGLGLAEGEVAGHEPDEEEAAEPEPAEPEPADPIRDRPPVTTSQALHLLTHGDIELIGRMPWSSNATFLVDITTPETATAAEPAAAEPEGQANPKAPRRIQAVYKPIRGERPLWDFPEGLHVRERACFLLSESLGWNLVPPTVIRQGPLGEGSLQLFMLADFSQHYLTLKDDPRHQPALMRLCAFDILANSTDRKSGHVLVCETDTLGGNRIFAVDNGLSFHAQFKVRTVIWDYENQPLPADIKSSVAALLEPGMAGQPDKLDWMPELLSETEIQAFNRRAQILLKTDSFPADNTGHAWPWPLV